MLLFRQDSENLDFDLAQETILRFGIETIQSLITRQLQCLDENSNLFRYCLDKRGLPGVTGPVFKSIGLIPEISTVISIYESDEKCGAQIAGNDL